MWKILQSVNEVVFGSGDAGEAISKLDDYSKSESDDKTETKVFVGRVTNIFHDYGLVDNEIYFPLVLFSNCGGITVGQKVQVYAKRKGRVGGWRAESVEKCAESDDTITANDYDWTSTTNGSKQSNEAQKLDKQEPVKTVSLQVQSANQTGGSLSSGFSFDLSVCDSGFKPERGDWVNATIEQASENGWGELKALTPTRWRQFTGKVSGIDRNGGYIDGEIFFLRSACIGDVMPQKWSKVSGQAVESETSGGCVWRATTVTVIEDANKTPLSKIGPSPVVQQCTNELFSAKEGIEVTDILDFGNMIHGTTKTLVLLLRHGGSECKRLLSYTLSGSSRGQFKVDSVEASAPTIATVDLRNVCIWPASILQVKVTCTARYSGQDWQVGTFDFGTFSVGHKVQVCVSDVAENILAPSGAYARRRILPSVAPQHTSGNVWHMPGQRPDRSDVARPNKDQPLKMPANLPPDDLNECVCADFDPVKWSSDITADMDVSNYHWKMKVLLHLEDIQHQIDLREFDMERVCLRPIGPFLALQVSGLSEGRPSVMVGDRVFLSDPGNTSDEPIEYEGYIHEIHTSNEEVLLKFHPEFHSSYYGQDFNARFMSGRTTIRRCHYAVELSRYVGSHVLFPTEISIMPPQVSAVLSSSAERPAVIRSPMNMSISPRGIVSPAASQMTALSPAKGGSAVRPVSLGSRSQGRGRGGVSFARRSGSQRVLTELKLFNNRLNERQRLAVQRILSGQARPLPYVLFGPPGTGKTVTLVEAILQVHHRLPHSRMLVCAPSNSAADLLAERLHADGSVGVADMARLNALYRPDESMAESIQQYSCAGETLEQVAHRRIVVCTCSTAGQLHIIKLPKGHFTHVFIDEAGQATEPEVLIALTLAAGGDNQVILAGDPRQLGPVVTSNWALKYGLGTSLLDRLMALPVYQRDERKFADSGNYDPLLVTKLVQNYRSHPLLLQLPSQLFYDNELVYAAPPSLSHRFVNWPQLPATDVPIVLHGVRGEEQREGNSPSWFNASEAVQVVRYLQHLLTDPLYGISANDIGVVTPYRKQVEKIRLLVEKFGLDLVKVGSVEEFQGQERLCIIISTVRSSEKMNNNTQHNLGFLRNPKRFNVAITRAQALLIIVGNPHVLNQDEHWSALLRFCVDKGAYVGCDLPEDLASCNSQQTGDTSVKGV